VTTNGNVDQPIIVSDIINVSGLNQLRGANDSNFGARFPDIQTICNEDIANKLGYKKDLFLLNLETKYKYGYNRTVFNGSL